MHVLKTAVGIVAVTAGDGQAGPGPRDRGVEGALDCRSRLGAPLARYVRFWMVPPGSFYVRFCAWLQRRLRRCRQAGRAIPGRGCATRALANPRTQDVFRPKTHAETRSADEPSEGTIAIAGSTNLTQALSQLNAITHSSQCRRRHGVRMKTQSI